MPQITWERLTRQPGDLHLVAGALPPAKGRHPGVRRRDAYREELTGRLVAVLRPKGRWALRSEGDEAGNEVKVAFSRRSDAERIGVVVEARNTARYEGWATQRRFVFDDAAERRIAAILGPKTAG